MGEDTKWTNGQQCICHKGNIGKAKSLAKTTNSRAVTGNVVQKELKGALSDGGTFAMKEIDITTYNCLREEEFLLA